MEEKFSEKWKKIRGGEMEENLSEKWKKVK